MAKIVYRIDKKHRLTKNADRIRVLVEAAARCCGGQIQLAEALGVTRGAVCQWLAGETAPTYAHEAAMLEIIEKEQEEVCHDH